MSYELVALTSVIPSVSEGRVAASVVEIGAGATLAMDLWNSFLKHAFGIPSLNYCLLGRWVGHMKRGRFTHRSIAAAERIRGECALGWAAHYGIGLMLAAGFVRLVGQDWLDNPTILPAVLYGIGTIVFPLFVLQPALGLGVASSRTPNPAMARLKSLATHTVFGLGLYASALLLTPFTFRLLP